MKISNSARERYQTCPRSYYNHYMLKLRTTQERSPLKFGDAMDIGFDSLLLTRDLEQALTAFKGRWADFKNLPLGYSKADTDASLIEGLDVSDGGPAWHSLLQKGIVMLTEYNTQVMPKIKEVLSTQLTKLFPNDSNDLLTVKPDAIVRWEDGRILLLDNKTSSVSYKPDSVRNSAQLAIYYEMLKEEYKLDACGYIVIPKRINKKKIPRIKIDVIIDNVSEETIEKTLAEYDTVLNDIKDAKFDKNINSCKTVFGPCDFVNYCHKNKDMSGLLIKD